MNKKGQLSYEYIVIIGMILLLIIPFFFTFFRYLLGGFDNQMNADMVVRVSQATETLANLGGVGSKFSIPVRVAKISQNSLQANTLSVQTTNGQTYSAAISLTNVKVGSEALVGEGFMTVPLIYTYLDTVVVGQQPQIVAICPEEESPYSSLCTLTTTTQPSEGFRLLGANFASNSEVIMSKIQGSTGGCQTMVSCTQDATCDVGQSCQNGICADISPPITVSEGGLIADVGTAQTGVGTYDIAIANPGGQKSDCVAMEVRTIQTPESECGNSIVELDEECDPPTKYSEQCRGDGEELLMCLPDCTCKD